MEKELNEKDLENVYGGASKEVVESSYNNQMNKQEDLSFKEQHLDDNKNYDELKKWLKENAVPNDELSLNDLESFDKEKQEIRGAHLK